MKVYKFGGASLASAAGFAQVARILASEGGDLFVIASALGKSTNALEGVLEAFLRGDSAQALARVERLAEHHRAIACELFGESSQAKTEVIEALDALVEELKGLVAGAVDSPAERLVKEDMWYDRIVSYGELLSSSLLSRYLRFGGLPCCWLDMRELLKSDERHREASVLFEPSAELLEEAVRANPTRIYLSQGFIAGTRSSEPTTLGREGSDYSAAAIAYLLRCESVTIWKDVPGVLNGDPRIFDDTVLIPQLTYLDAIELAYSGAQVIHPKTIKPLQNRQIPLYVRSFVEPDGAGSVIRSEMDAPIAVPIRILKANQVLISIRPQDFSFVLEEQLPRIFSLMNDHRMKINLIQSSAVNLTLCVDSSRRLEEVIGALQRDFRVVYNSSVELLTIRGYNAQSLSNYAQGEHILLCQRTRRTLRLVRRTLRLVRRTQS